MAKQTIKFTKMHGAGNDYVYIDCFAGAEPERPDQLAIRLADRHTGIGGDGLILICRSNKADGRMRMFNADGSEAEMCGNGIRCVAKYMHDHDLAPKKQLDIETNAGILSVQVITNAGVAERVRVDMGEPILQPNRIPTTLVGAQAVNVPISIVDREFIISAVSMGNPHCVVFVEELTDELVRKWGPLIENSIYFPARVNVEFVKVVSRTEVIQRTWERGSGETLACGTGASAVCVAGVLAGRTERKILNHLTGGDLELEWNADSNHVFKTGPATEVFQGTWFGSW